MRYLIRHIGLLPAFLFGGLLGLLMSLLPSLALGYLIVRMAARAMAAFASLAFEIPLPLNQSLPVDLVQLLQLESAQQAVTRIGAGGGAMVATIAVTIVLFSAIGGALAGLIGALLFNLIARLTGGIEVSAEVVDPEIGLPPVAASPLLPAGVAADPNAAEARLPLSPKTAWLEQVGDPRHRWGLVAGVTRIGSDAGNPVAIKDLQAHHAEIRYEDLRYYVVPLGGPVQVNDVDVTARHSLRDGARLTLGPVHLTFHLPGNG